MISRALFQSTRPRGARHFTAWVGIQTYIFQSPRPRGARRGVNVYKGGAVEISIHASTRGATTAQYLLGHSSIHFNPRAHEGRDRLCPLCQWRLSRFQSPRPRGARQGLKMEPHEVARFQSPRPRGARPAAVAVAAI